MSSTSTERTALLDASFVQQLEAMRRMLSVRTSSAGAGEHLAKRRGASAEFREHRAYAPGDDLRRVDWAAYARTGEPVLKEFRAEEDLLVRIVLDTSASLEGPKLDAAVRIAAALGYVGLAASERVQVLPFASAPLAPTKPLRGRGGVAPLIRALAAVRPAGSTDLSRAIERACARGRPGLLAVVSDFFDPGAFEAALTRARAAGHDVALVQVLARDELEPTLHGEVLLEDSETGETLALSADAEAIEQYLARLGGLIASLRRWARTHGAVYVRAAADDALDRVVRRVLERRIDA